MAKGHHIKYLKEKLLFVIYCVLIIAATILTVVIAQSRNHIVTDNLAVSRDTKFGGVYIDITIDEFNNLGFEYGDSVDIIFSNGYELLDIPYYNGYYVDMGDPLLVAYPGYPSIKAGINYGEDLWNTANLTEDKTATIKLNQRNKFLNIQQSRDIHYTDIQGDIEDVIFANFRNVKVGNLKEGILYRSASPVDNSHNRAPVVDRLIAPVGINFIINLSDDANDLVDHISKEDFNSPYFLSLYQKGKVLPLGMDAQFKGDTFKEKLVKGLTAMSKNSGPYLIHCVEGKDRTGYVMMILEALLGASYDEMIDDYMITYDNYYGITKEDDSNRYNTIKDKNIDLMLHYIIGDEAEEQNLANITNYSTYTKDYLLSIGMTEASLNQLIDNLRA